ncbi:MAG: hypothetical protein GYB66_12300 [Chloroflexi bacterium]|nr:hypothetical protein [Chloroflexota bacterium]
MSRLEQQPDPNREEEQLEGFQAHGKQEAEEAHRRLAMSDDEANATRLQQVEHLLRNAPLLSVPIGFADRVIASLKGHENGHPRYEDALGIVLGLSFAALIAIAVMGTLALLIFQVLLETATITDLAEGIGDAFETVIPVAGITLDPSVAIPLGILIGIGLLLFSGYAVRVIRGIVKSGATASHHEESRH